MVQVKTVVPVLMEVMVELGELGVVTTPDPLKIVHVPWPYAGIFPVNVVNDSQMSLSGPASAAGATASRVKVTVSDVERQTPFVIVQTNEFAPTPRPVTAELGLAAFEMAPVPEISVQFPAPTTAALPPRVITESQTD